MHWLGAIARPATFLGLYAMNTVCSTVLQGLAEILGFPARLSAAHNDLVLQGSAGMLRGSCSTSLAGAPGHGLHQRVLAISSRRFYGACHLPMRVRCPIGLHRRLEREGCIAAMGA